MIHDLDIVLHVVKSPVKSINASGVSVLSSTPDIANARIEFINGCVANITSSRMSLNNIRKSRFFQKNAYVSVDFLNRSHEYIRLDSNKIPKENSPFQNTKTIPEESVMIQTQNNSGINPIEEELKSFINSIATNINPTVDLESAKCFKAYHRYYGANNHGTELINNFIIINLIFAFYFFMRRFFIILLIFNFSCQIIDRPEKAPSFYPNRRFSIFNLKQ